MNPLARTIPCTNPHCHRPVATIVNGSLVIISRHGGEKHQGIISLETLLQLLQQNSLTDAGKNVLSCATATNNR